MHTFRQAQEVINGLRGRRVINTQLTKDESTVVSIFNMLHGEGCTIPDASQQLDIDEDTAAAVIIGAADMGLVVAVHGRSKVVYRTIRD